MSCLGRKVRSSGQLNPTDRADKSSRQGVLRGQDSGEETTFSTMAPSTGQYQLL